jgi:DNA adenine methylase
VTLPFLKWAGGKQALLPQLKPLFPTDFTRLLDPFLGGGSIFFGLEPKEAILGDANAWLVGTYEIVRDDPEALLSILPSFVNTREAYLQNRAVNPQELPPVMRAALSPSVRGRGGGFSRRGGRGADRARPSASG